MLRVVLDRLGPEELVGIEDCQRVSHDLGTLLDVEDELTAGLPEGYTLEVSSPGLDRPLRGEADYRRFVGRLAKIVTKAPVDGSRISPAGSSGWTRERWYWRKGGARIACRSNW